MRNRIVLINEDSTKSVSVTQATGKTGLDVNMINASSVGGGVQYTEGDVDASITGTAVMWEDTGDTIRVASAAKPLPVAVITGGGSGGGNTTASGSLTAVSQNVDVSLVACSQVGLVITGTWAGTISFKGSVDGTTFSNLNGIPLDGSGASSSATSGNGSFTFPVGGLVTFRVTSLVWTSGTATINITANSGTHVVEVFCTNGVNMPVQATLLAGSAIAGKFGIDQTTPGTTNKVDIGTNGTVTANAGTNLNTSLLALDSTVAKDSSLSTINTSINTLLKPANTLAAVTTVGTITNVVHVDDNAGSLTVDNGGTFAVQAAQSGTWTVQPGNTANTTAWKVDASSVAVPVTDNGGSITVDNGGTFAVQATIASGATNIAKAEDSASADADVGVPAMAIRKATPANTSGTDGDYEMLQMSAGRLWTSSVIDTALPAGTNAIGKLSANSGVTIGAVEIAAAQTLATVTTVSTVTNLSQMNGQAIAMGTGVRSAGTQRVTIATDDVVPVSQSGTWSITNGASATVGGLTQSRTDALVATPVSVKASAGQVYGYHIANLSGADAYVHFYNIASGSVTVGVSTRTRTLYVPDGGLLDSSLPFGLTFGTAITIAATTTITGSSAPATGLLVMVDYV